jgi:hypothetical protein
LKIGGSKRERGRDKKKVKEIKEFVSKCASRILVGYKLHGSHASMGIKL